MARVSREERKKEYVEQYNKDHPDTPLQFIRGKISMTLDLDSTDQEHTRITHINEMKDQGPPRRTHISQMTEDVPHREGLKTTGLTSQEVADLELSEEEMAAIGGEDVPMTEEEKGALKSLGLVKTESKKITTANVSKDFDKLIYEAKDLSIKDQLDKYYFIKNKLKEKLIKIETDYKDYTISDIPDKAKDSHKKAKSQLNDINNIISHLTISPTKTPKKAVRNISV
jgi:hypothetical protein